MATIMAEDAGHYVMFSLLFLASSLSPFYQATFPIVIYAYFRISLFIKVL